MNENVHQNNPGEQCCGSNDCCGTTATASTATANAERVFLPRVDIVETEEGLRLQVDLPGVDEEGLDITLEKNVLTLRGKVRRTAPEGYTLSYREYDEGDFERTFTIPEGVDRTGIEASLKQGTLWLKLPKAKEVLSKKIPVVSR